MKKVLLLIFILTILMTGCNKKQANMLIDSNMKLLSSSVENNYEINEFEIDLITDKENLKINKKFLKDIKVYKLEAVIYDGFNYYENKYYGIKLSDVLAKLDNIDYTVMYFYDNEAIRLGFLKKKLTDNEYLAFNIDGKNDNQISLIRLDTSTRYWLHDLREIVLSDYLR